MNPLTMMPNQYLMMQSMMPQLSPIHAQVPGNPNLGLGITPANSMGRGTATLPTNFNTVAPSVSASGGGGGFDWANALNMASGLMGNGGGGQQQQQAQTLQGAGVIMPQQQVRGFQMPPHSGLFGLGMRGR